MRTLIGDGSVEELYAWPDRPWLRVNMVSTVDGAAQGPDGLTGTINNAVDKAVFHLLRRDADVLLVGAGTVRAEGYRPPGKPMVVLGSSLPPQLDGHPDVRLHAGGDAAALQALVADLHSEGLTSILSEGGPTLLGSLLHAGLVDELCATITPQLIAGSAKRIVDGPVVDVPLRLASLVEEDGTLLARWHVTHLAE